MKEKEHITITKTKKKQTRRKEKGELFLYEDNIQIVNQSSIPSDSKQEFG